MTAKLLPALSIAALLVCSTPAVAQGAPWIHVEVQEDDSQTHVNVPLALAELVVGVVPDRLIGKVTRELAKEGIALTDVRKMWTALREVGDAEFVTVDSNDESVRVGREGELLVVSVEKDDGDETVQIEMPIDVVDALLSGDDDILNLPAALERLRDRRGDIVNVADGDETVRIWIDERG